MQSNDDISNWLHLSKENNDPVAQYNLGVLYGEGKGVPKNYQDSIKWYRLSADQAMQNHNLAWDLCIRKEKEFNKVT